jgi:nicotinate-nucleotide adenylyltransferase
MIILRIGVFSSSFDPVNFGHLLAADVAIMRANLNKILFVPTNAQRYDRRLAPDKHRVKLLNLALKGRDELFEIERSEIQIQRGFHHPYYTMEYLAEKYQGCQLYYIIESHKLADIPKWVRAEEFVQRNNFIVFCRNDVNIIKEISEIPMLRKYLTTNFSFISEGTAVGTSSEYIRQRFADLDPPYFMLPDKCIEYIDKHRLYRKDYQTTSFEDDSLEEPNYKELIAVADETEIDTE